MPRASRTGIRGLTLGADGRRRIDLRYTDSNGRPQRHKEVFPPGTPARAAEIRAKEVLAAALTGTLTPRGERSAPLTLGAALDEYLSWCKVNGRGDPKYKERHRDRVVEVLGADMALTDVSELTIERFKKARRDAGKEPGTVNRELVSLKHFLGRCVDWGWIAKRPKITLLREPPPRVRWLSESERAQLAKALAKPQRAAFGRLVTAALLSGQRLGNLIALRRADVDLVHHTMTLPKTKSGKRHHVPISPALAEVLTAALATSKGDHVFVPQRGGGKHPYTRSGVSTFFARVSQEAGLTDFRFHDLRHDFATAVRRSGHGLDVVQALLGHASPAMTQRYVHLGRDALSSAVSNLAPLVAPALPPGPPAHGANRRKSGRKSARQRAS
jgi:integrase